MSNPIPKFQFNNSSIKSDAELDQKLAASGKTSGGSKYLKTGQHETVIKSVEYTGAAKDSRWGTFKVTYEGTDSKTTNEYLLVPFSEPMYKKDAAAKETAYPFQRLQKFMKALGVNLKIENLQDILTEYFSKPEKSLVGQNIVVNVGYEGNYVEYIRKNPAGGMEFGIYNKDNVLLTPMVFPDRTSAVEHAEQNQIPLKSFPSVLVHMVSKTPTKKVAGNW